MKLVTYAYCVYFIIIIFNLFIGRIVFQLITYDVRQGYKQAEFCQVLNIQAWFEF